MLCSDKHQYTRAMGHFYMLHLDCTFTRTKKPQLADLSRWANRGFKLCEYWLFRIIPYFSFYMEFHGISDPECRESEVQITSTSLSKHSYLPTKKSELKKPGNGWCAWVFSGASIPFGKYGCGGRIWTDGLRVMSPTSYRTAPPRDIVFQSAIIIAHWFVFVKYFYVILQMQ